MKTQQSITLHQTYSCKIDKNGISHTKNIKTLDKIFEDKQDAEEFCNSKRKIETLYYSKPVTFEYFGDVSSLSKGKPLYRIVYFKKDAKGNYNSNKPCFTNTIFESDADANAYCEHINHVSLKTIYFYRPIELKPYISLDLTR